MPEKTFFQQQITEVGATPKNSTIAVLLPKNVEQNRYDDKKVELPIFSEDKHGNLEILVCAIDRKLITRPQKKADDPKAANYNREDYFHITRLKEPKGDMKYSIPKGWGTRPFFPPNLLDAYEKKEKIKTLVFTEGYKKAFRASLAGVPIVGFSSITHIKDSEGKLYPDVIKLLARCEVENVIWLHDGDCRNISASALKENEDISIRPSRFFASIQAFKRHFDEDLPKEHDCSMFWACVNTVGLAENNEKHPKGLDDLLNDFAEKNEDIAKELLKVTQKGEGNYFVKFPISGSLVKVKDYFGIGSAKDFYTLHEKELCNKPLWKFYGSTYRWDKEKEEPVLEVPREANQYFRVGDDYFEYVQVPNKYKELERVFHKRNITTITDDHGKKIKGHIPKYKAFCNVPDHVNYQQILHSCYNMYAPIEHTPEQGDFDVTIEFLRHIFGEQYEIGLDYIQLLFTNPQQVLPILCLVSKENATGKTTFAKWLKVIFKQNMTILGNQELEAEFNTSYAAKLIVCVDETFIEKKRVIEKVKSLSTADKITLNAKGKDHVEIDFFGKFIMLTNNEENFIYATEDDLRYWIRKVPRPKKDSPNLLEEMLIPEISAFLYFLLNRKLSVPTKQSRMWFEPASLVTDALKAVRAQSKPTIEKEIRSKMRNMFVEFGEEKILMSTAVCIETLWHKNRYEESYLSKVLRENIGVDYVRTPTGEKWIGRYQVPSWQYESDGNEFVKYHKYRGMPFEFKRELFFTPEEIAELFPEKEDSDVDSEIQIKIPY